MLLPVAITIVPIHIFYEAHNWPIVDNVVAEEEAIQPQVIPWQSSCELVKLCTKSRFLASVLVICVYEKVCLFFL